MSEEKQTGSVPTLPNLQNDHWPLPLGAFGPRHKTWLFGPTQVHTPNCTSIGSSVFVGLTVVSNRQTTLHLCCLCMRKR